MVLELKDKILETLGKEADKAGYSIYVVGGYVRDFILGKKDTDIDIMVLGDATEFAHIAAKKFSTELNAVYKNFGTALLIISQNDSEYKIEFASARKESYNRNSRKPEVVSANLEEDISRRDFTINTLAVALNNKNYGELIDLYNGVEDIKNGIIKTPLDPLRTFDDDPLRIMRAIRFASKLNIKIEEKTYNAIVKMKDRLADSEVVSVERVTDEFLKILMTPKPSIGLDLMFKTGVMAIVFPEISIMAGIDQRKDYHHKDVFYHTLEVVDNISQKTDKLWLRFAALVHDIAKPKTKKFVEGIGWTFHAHEEVGARMMKKIFQRMRLPLVQLPYIEKLIRLHLRPIPLAKEEVTDSAIRRLAAEAGEDLEDLLTLCRADITSKNIAKVSKFFKNYEVVEKKIVEVQEKDKLRNFQSPVRGEEIMEYFKIPPSKAVGIIKKKIEDAILEGEIPNEYVEARKYMETLSI